MYAARWRPRQAVHPYNKRISSSSRQKTIKHNTKQSQSDLMADDAPASTSVRMLQVMEDVINGTTSWQDCLGPTLQQSRQRLIQWKDIEYPRFATDPPSDSLRSTYKREWSFLVGKFNAAALQAEEPDALICLGEKDEFSGFSSYTWRCRSSGRCLPMNVSLPCNEGDSRPARTTDEVLVSDDTSADTVNGLDFRQLMHEFGCNPVHALLQVEQSVQHPPRDITKQFLETQLSTFDDAIQELDSAARDYPCIIMDEIRRFWVALAVRHETSLPIDDEQSLAIDRRPINALVSEVMMTAEWLEWMAAEEGRLAMQMFERMEEMNYYLSAHAAFYAKHASIRSDYLSPMAHHDFSRMPDLKARHHRMAAKLITMHNQGLYSGDPDWVSVRNTCDLFSYLRPYLDNTTTNVRDVEDSATPSTSTFPYLMVVQYQPRVVYLPLLSTMDQGYRILARQANLPDLETPEFRDFWAQFDWEKMNGTQNAYKWDKTQPILNAVIAVSEEIVEAHSVALYHFLLQPDQCRRYWIERLILMAFCPFIGSDMRKSLWCRAAWLARCSFKFMVEQDYRERVTTELQTMIDARDPQAPPVGLERLLDRDEVEIGTALSIGATQDRDRTSQLFVNDMEQDVDHEQDGNAYASSQGAEDREFVPEEALSDGSDAPTASSAVHARQGHDPKPGTSRVPSVPVLAQTAQDRPSFGHSDISANPRPRKGPRTEPPLTSGFIQSGAESIATSLPTPVTRSDASTTHGMHDHVLNPQPSQSDRLDREGDGFMTLQDINWIPDLDDHAKYPEKQHPSQFMTRQAPWPIVNEKLFSQGQIGLEKSLTDLSKTERLLYQHQLKKLPRRAKLTTDAKDGRTFDMKALAQLIMEPHKAGPKTQKRVKGTHTKADRHAAGLQGLFTNKGLLRENSPVFRLHPHYLGIPRWVWQIYTKQVWIKQWPLDRWYLGAEFFRSGGKRDAGAGMKRRRDVRPAQKDSAGRFVAVKRAVGDSATGSFTFVDEEMRRKVERSIFPNHLYNTLRTIVFKEEGFTVADFGGTQKLGPLTKKLVAQAQEKITKLNAGPDITARAWRAHADLVKMSRTQASTIDAQRRMMNVLTASRNRKAHKVEALVNVLEQHGLGDKAAEVLQQFQESDDEADEHGEEEERTPTRFTQREIDMLKPDIERLDLHRDIKGQPVGHLLLNAKDQVCAQHRKQLKARLAKAQFNNDKYNDDLVRYCGEHAVQL